MKRLLCVGVFCFLLVSCGPPQDGYGTYEHDDGTYVGAYKDGNMHGQDTYTFSDGTEYIGEWKNNLRHGQGTDTFANGPMYVGEWKDGKPREGTEYNKNRNVIATYSESVQKHVNY